MLLLLLYPFPSLSLISEIFSLIKNDYQSAGEFWRDWDEGNENKIFEWKAERRRKRMWTDIWYPDWYPTDIQWYPVDDEIGTFEKVKLTFYRRLITNALSSWASIDKINHQLGFKWWNIRRIETRMIVYASWLFYISLPLSPSLSPSLTHPFISFNLWSGQWIMKIKHKKKKKETKILFQVAD